MNDSTMKASPAKPAMELSALEGKNPPPSDPERTEPATMDELLKEWGAYMRLRSKIRQLFLQEPCRQPMD